jgi:hypothetical protein
MSVTYACTCGQVLRAKDDQVNKRCKCPRCGTILRVPAAVSEVPQSQSESNPSDRVYRPDQAAREPVSREQVGAQAALGADPGPAVMTSEAEAPAKRRVAGPRWVGLSIAAGLLLFITLMVAVRAKRPERSLVREPKVASPGQRAAPGPSPRPAPQPTLVRLSASRTHDSPSSGVPAPRMLENGEFPLITKASDMTWSWIAFSPDGQTLAATGEATRADGTTAIGRTRPTHSFLQIWNLSTYRSEKVQLLPLNAYQLPALRFTPDGKTLYASARDNQGQHDLARRGQAKRDAAGYVMIWPMDRAKPFMSQAPAGPEGLFAAAHLTADGRRLLLLHLSEGVQEYAVERTSPGRPPKKGIQPAVKTEISLRGTVSPLPHAVGQPAMFSPNGAILLARLTGGPGGLMVWDVAGKTVRARLAPPSDGAVARIAASNHASVVAIAAVKGRTIQVFDGMSGQSIAKIGPLDQSVAGLAITANGDSLLYASGGKLRIRKLPDGPDTILPGDDGIRGAVAVTPDGRLAAAGGRDGAVRLWSLRPVPEADLVKKPGPSELPLVAVGPRDVRVTTPQGTTKMLALVRLTPERAVFADGTAGKRTEAAADDQRFVTIETVDGKQTWKLDPDKKLYVGPKLVPTARLSVPAPRQATSEQEDLDLLLSVRRLLAAATEMVDQPEQHEAVAEIRRQALERRDYLKKAGRAQAVAELYTDLATAVDELERAAADRRAVVAEINGNAIEAASRRGKASGEHGLDTVLDLGMVLLGTLPRRGEIIRMERYRDEFGWHDIPIYREYPMFPGAFEAGTMHLLNDAVASKARQAQLKAAEAAADAKTGRLLVAALRARNNAVDRVADRYHAIAARDFGLEKPVPPPAASDAAGIDPTLAWLDAEARRIRGRTGRDDPFALANMIVVRSLASPANGTVALFERAQEIVALIPLVPPAAIHDSDRAALLGLAAELVALAVAAETGDRPVTEAYSEKAAYAVSLLDQALALQPGDPSGKFREARAIALAQADRLPEALAQAGELVDRKPQSPGAHYTLARLECGAGNIDRGLDHLEQAVVKLGFRNLVEARARPEFPRSHPRFKDLTELQLKVRGATGLGLSNATVSIRNTGLFALHDVRFRVRYLAKEPTPGWDPSKVLKLPGKNASQQERQAFQDEMKRRMAQAKSQQKPKPRQEVAEAALETLLPNQSYILFTNSPPVARGPSPANMTWVDAAIIVSAPAQGTVELPIK